MNCSLQGFRVLSLLTLQVIPPPHRCTPPSIWNIPDVVDHNILGMSDARGGGGFRCTGELALKPYINMWAEPSIWQAD